MAEIFKKAGAKYVCFVTKHHDGFLLWHSEYPNPQKDNYMASRDIVGELSKAVKNKGMRMTFYYSGALDWSFNPNPIRDVPSFLSNGPTSPEYTEYANNHWYELIDKYGTDILWNDIGYPPDADIYELFAYYYNKNPDGVINDRWMQVGKRLRKIAKAPLIRNFVNWVAKKVMAGGGGASPAPFHCDYRTPEYRSFPEIQKHKWETCRGVGNSFGYNKEEKDEDYLTPEDLIRMFADIVSKNGNLLLNVGPMADGTIPEIQQKCILGLGKWLDVNGEAIYGTRPWTRAESETTDEIGVRFTQKPNALYVIILDKPKTSEITIKSLRIDEFAKISLFGIEGTLEWTQQDENLTIKVPEKLEDFPAYTFKITPKP
jgi:alpha-L-fucosidase